MDAMPASYLSIVGALAERHLVDPAKIAEWAEFFATGMENSALNSSNSQGIRSYRSASIRR
jgi:hypothetical protein